MDLKAVTTKLQKRCLTVKAGPQRELSNINVGIAPAPRQAPQPTLLAPPQGLSALMRNKTFRIVE
jgi:hypothetical protein